jgi:hypothetical protein
MYSAQPGGDAILNFKLLILNDFDLKVIQRITPTHQDKSGPKKEDG